MIKPITTPGRTYAVTSPNGCTVTQHVGEATIVHDVPAGVQVLIIAQAARMEVSDDAAVVTECGGSAELVFTAATTRAASSGSGCDGMTAEERALLMGAAQRDADNTFSAGNTFTGAVDMSGAQVTPPEGWNVADLTPEAIQQVVPMAWDAYGGIRIGENITNTRKQFPTIGIGKDVDCSAPKSVVIGNKAKAISSADTSICIGESASATIGGSVAIGQNSKVEAMYAIAMGARANTNGKLSTSVGSDAKTTAYCAITLGSQFTETTDSGNVTHTCTTEGTGSITIGAGANTLNNGDTESSNSVTIGCKALNQGADSVVIGAQASNPGSATIIIGTGAKNEYGGSGVIIGTNAKAYSVYPIAIGYGATAGNCGVALGRGAAAQERCFASGLNTKAMGAYSIALGDVASARNTATAIGRGATASDYGAVAFRSTAEDGTYTQLYFSGANTPLANTYENGEAMMGYVVRDSAGNIMTDAEGNAMVGTQKLSVLFPNNRGENAFTPAMLSMDEDWTPKPMFRPSDLDMPQEEPTEPQEYTPLPVYPIVEPEIPDMEEV